MSRFKTATTRRKAKNLTKISGSRIPEWWLTEYFGPLEQFVERIQREATVDVSTSGLPLQYLPDGRTYHPVTGMISMGEVFQIAKLRDTSCPCSGQLFHVAIKLGTGQLLALEEVENLRDCLRELRAYASSQSRSKMIDLILTACIKLEMGKRDAKHAAIRRS